MKKINSRHYSRIDRFILQAQTGVETIFGEHQYLQSNPARGLSEPKLNEKEKRRSIGYMRVNHAGEVSAQALYQGHQISVKSPEIAKELNQAAHEEINHLMWCHERLEELNGQRSVFNVFWYTNAFLIGALAGLIGDAWALGFVDETERQVAKHLEGHLHQLPTADIKSRMIVNQMRDDEIRHGQMAHHLGAKELPSAIKLLMKWHAKVMTTLSYWA